MTTVYLIARVTESHDGRAHLLEDPAWGGKSQ